MQTPSFERSEIEVMVMSMCGPLMNKIKMAFQYPRKNVDLANNNDIKNLIFLIGEQLLPQWCMQNLENGDNINKMHNLMYLLAYKTQQIFFSRVIHAIIDQNWDLKGFKQVFMRVLELLEVNAKAGGQSLGSHLDKLLASQNLQSTSCIKAIGSFLRNQKKAIVEDDLSNPIKTYQTDFEFIKEDIERFRSQNMNHECFQVLHPWAYELDSVDFKYIVNNCLVKDICSKLKSRDAQVFWLTFFKPQKACSSDEFFEAIRQLCEINKIQDYYASKEQAFEQVMIETRHMVSIDCNADLIQDVIDDFVAESMNQNGYCAIQHQLRLYQTQFDGTIYADEQSLGSAYTYDKNPRMEYFKSDQVLGSLALKDMPGKDIQRPSLLQRRECLLMPDIIPDKRLKMKFESVDTEELKNVEINFEGDRGLFKIGEGEANHYQIPNDKKLWETQFMIVCIGGKYYIRDLGFVHTSRVKLDKRSEVQIQKGSIVDLGKVVHYHFDKAIHKCAPSQTPSENFYTMRPSDVDFDLDTEDFPHLRARPTWVSADENVDNIQNEINIYADGNKLVNSVGRSMKRDIQIKLKAVSADHCAIAYTDEKGWTITERGKDKTSSNGTFMFMKSMQQMTDHIPSDLIPLHDDMIISFVNYELRVSLHQKTSDELNAQNAAMNEFFSAKYAGQAPPAAPMQTPPAPEEPEEVAPTYTAEVQPAAEIAESERPAEEPLPTPAANAEGVNEEQPAQDGEGEATEEELAHAATKIGAAFRGKKARDEVAQIKAQRESDRTEVAPSKEDNKPAEDEPQPVQEANEEEAKANDVEDAPTENAKPVEEAKPSEDAPAE